MALPAGGAQWPPLLMGKAYEMFQVWDAWYAGDTEALQWLYATNRLQRQTSVWGQVKRMFWGTPTPMNTGQRPIKLHVPVPGEVARLSAQIEFGEMPYIGFGDGDNDDDDKGLTKSAARVSSDRLVEILDDRAHAAMLEMGELKSALGGAYLRINWDRSVVPDKPFLGAVAADQAVPEFAWGRLSAVTFWRDLAAVDGRSQHYKILERHAPGSIEFGLYEASTAMELGIRVPLTEHPDTASFAGAVDEQSMIYTGSKLLTAVYIPNLAPNRLWRKDPVICNLGRSDFDGAEDLFDSIDETYTSWMRDIRLGKARIMVPKGFLQKGAPGESAVFNSDQEIFNEVGQMYGSNRAGLASAGNSSQSFIQMFQPNIRFKEHMETAMHLLAKAYQACGYSPQSFGDAADVAVTATEINARDKLTLGTRGSKILYDRPELSQIFAAALDVDKFIFKGPGRGLALPRVEFPDASTTPPEIVAQTLNLLNTAEAASIEERVRILHPDWIKGQIDAEVDKIRIDLSMLPFPKPELLYAAQSATGSASGGVDVNSYGVKGVDMSGVPVNAPVKAPDVGKGGKIVPGPQPGAGK